jgi:AmiR/NasT family two-component response regulator
MPNTNPLRVLLVDDDVLVINVVRELLEEAGHTVVGNAPDGQLALELTKSLRPDIVFMDIEMPGMSGLEATRQIQEQCPVPVILLTAHEDAELIAVASRVGAAAYLVKLPNPGELTRTMAIARARFADLMELRALNAKLQQALAEVKTLRGLVPICSRCKCIRDEKGYWQRVETYISERTEAQFSHGVCDDCIKVLYPELNLPRFSPSAGDPPGG